MALSDVTKYLRVVLSKDTYLFELALKSPENCRPSAGQLIVETPIDPQLFGLAPCIFVTLQEKSLNVMPPVERVGSDLTLLAWLVSGKRETATVRRIVL